MLKNFIKFQNYKIKKKTFKIQNFQNFLNLKNLKKIQNFHKLS